MVGAFNRPGMVATLGMSKNKHLKVLVENKNEVLEVVPGKARMVHVFAEKIIIKKLGEKMNTCTMKDEGEDSGGGAQANFAPIPVLKLKVPGELVGE